MIQNQEQKTKVLYGSTTKGWEASNMLFAINKELPAHPGFSNAKLEHIIDKELGHIYVVYYWQ